MARVGRPRMENARRYKAELRFTQEEYEVFTRYAADHNMSMTDVLRKGLQTLYDLSDQGEES